MLLRVLALPVYSVAERPPPEQIPRFIAVLSLSRLGHQPLHLSQCHYWFSKKGRTDGSSRTVVQIVLSFRSNSLKLSHGSRLTPPSRGGRKSLADRFHWHDIVHILNNYITVWGFTRVLWGIFKEIRRFRWCGRPIR